jgi:hypothetical protein
MEAKELRVGSRVNFLGKEKQLLGLSKRNYQMETETATYYAEFENHIPVMYVHLQPIPLTEEWLMKFGFYKDINGMFLAGVFELSWMEDDFIKNQYTLRIAKGICLKIKYVHQLQNLYFALTGKELETKTK